MANHFNHGAHVYFDFAVQPGRMPGLLRVGVFRTRLALLLLTSWFGLYLSLQIGLRNLELVVVSERLSLQTFLPYRLHHH